MTTVTEDRAQFLADVITAAIEGGTGYWARVYTYKWVDLPPAEVYATIVPMDVEEEQPPVTTREQLKDFLSEHGRVINGDLIARGIRRIAAGEAPVRSDLVRIVRMADRTNDAGMIDAEGADVIVQAGLFGSVVYG